MSTFYSTCPQNCACCQWTAFCNAWRYLFGGRGHV